MDRRVVGEHDVLIATIMGNWCRTRSNRDVVICYRGVPRTGSINPNTNAKDSNPSGQMSSLLQNIERANFTDSIMIHVIDDSKNEKRDFTFSRSLLVKYMKYFDKCLKKISDQDEIDISIHCDAVIFEWLLNYIFSMEEYEKKHQSNKGVSGSSGWQLNL